MKTEHDLPLHVSSHRCANGETMEWRLRVGSDEVCRFFTSENLTPADASGRLLALAIPAEHNAEVRAALV